MLTDYTDESEVTQYLPKTITAGNGKEFPVFDAEGKAIAAHLPFSVPGRYIKIAEYQGDVEIFACLDVPLRVENQDIRPPSLGVWSLLETFASPFYHLGDGINLIDCCRALYINEYRASCARDVYNWRNEFDEESFDIADESTYTDLDRQVVEYGSSLGFDIENADNWLEIRRFFEISFSGWAMIPPGGGSSKFMFGAETMGGVIASLGKSFSVPISTLLWETPVCLIGHATASAASQNGAKGVGRPKDPADIRKQLILAAAREYKGELHPWQIEEPLSRRLTAIQGEHEHLVTEFEELRAKAAKKAGRKI